MEKLEIWLFGASVGAKHIYDTFANIGIRVVGFVDNNKNKWNTIFEGVKVYNPEVLKKLKNNQRIIIASIYYDEILEQLHEMGIDRLKLILKEELILDYFLNTTDFKIYEMYFKQKEKIYLDMSEGFQVSGPEKWSITIAQELHRRKCDYEILSTKMIKDNRNVDEKLNIHWINFKFDHYQEAVFEMVERIEKNLPAKIIVNRVSQVLVAAMMLKQKYPDKITLISVIHSDYSKIYEQNQYLIEKVDKFICVSPEIKNKFIEKYGCKEEKAEYLMSPIDYLKEYKREYLEKDKFITIGYAARLEKAQKRSDLLIPLIQKLETSEIPYILNIAGQGSIYHKIEEFICVNKVDNVHLYGEVSFEKMNDFWKQCDIVINLSDLEGTALCMMEGMAWGCVPIVTHTSGVDAMIIDGINGYIVEKGDIDNIFAHICLLYNNKNMLSIMGEKSMDIIQENCDVYKYVNRILDI